MPTIIERHVTQTIVNERNCLHGVDSEKRFVCQALDDTYIMACPERCGFYLNFSPDFAGADRKADWFNRGVTFVNKYKMVDQPRREATVEGGYTVVRTSFHKMQQEG